MTISKNKAPVTRVIFDVVITSPKKNRRKNLISTPTNNYSTCLAAEQNSVLGHRHCISYARMVFHTLSDINAVTELFIFEGLD
jgi:hypothetical protein